MQGYFNPGDQISTAISGRSKSHSIFSLEASKGDIKKAILFAGAELSTATTIIGVHCIKVCVCAFASMLICRARARLARFHRRSSIPGAIYDDEKEKFREREGERHVNMSQGFYNLYNYMYTFPSIHNSKHPVYPFMSASSCARDSPIES